MYQSLSVWIFLILGVSNVLSQWQSVKPPGAVVDLPNPHTRGTDYQSRDGPPYGRVSSNVPDVRPHPRPHQPIFQEKGNQGMGSEYMAKDGPPFGNIPNQSGSRQPQVPVRRTPSPGPDRTRPNKGVPMYRPSDPNAPFFGNRSSLRNETPQREPDDGRRLEAQRREERRFNQRQPVNPRQNTDQRIAGGYDPYHPTQVSQDPGSKHRHPMVAFSGTLQTHQYFYRTTRVIFDNVLTNIGRGYDITYGIFTAPVPGVYLINYHAMSRPDGTIPAGLDLVKNQYIINSAVGRGLAGSPSNSAVLFLRPYDRVYLQGRTGTSIYCETGHAYCSFNIVLISSGTF